jgi:glycerophosphoryl diester phosphodiesterase
MVPDRAATQQALTLSCDGLQKQIVVLIEAEKKRTVHCRPRGASMVRVTVLNFCRVRHGTMMRRGNLWLGLLLTACMWGGVSVVRAGGEMSDCPFAAHNAYPWRLYAPGRFEQALDAGLKHIEVDITFDPVKKKAVATHDAKPNGKETELGTLLEPMWKKWLASDEQGYTLILDFKTSSPELVEAVAEVLEPYREQLSTLGKEAGSKFEERKITVCLTGNTAAHRLYAESVPAEGAYLAFGDLGGNDWRADVASYVPKEPAGFVRFLTYERSAFQDAQGAKGDNHLSVERLAKLMELARQRNYHVRIYTLNPPKKAGESDTTAWSRCVEAGVEMISTDAYPLARQWWLEHGSAAVDR